MQNLCTKLNVKYTEYPTNIRTLLERLFMVGEKGKRYYSDLNGFEIHSSEDSVFDKIGSFYKKSLSNKNPKVVAFYDKNPALKAFFSSKRFKEEFIEIITPLNRAVKLAIINYYLTLLHQLAAINYKQKSHYVSCSTSHRVARKFAENGKSRSDGIILHCWQPIKTEKIIVQHFGLPTYTFPPYPFQREISYLGGIFPHFISGIEFLGTNKFFPNNNIFKNDITDDTFLHGLEIDQRNFNKIAQLTKYKTTIRTNGTEIWESTSR